MKEKTKQSLSLGFAIYLAFTLLLTADFIVNLLKSPIKNYLDTIGVLYFIPSALGHAALFSLFPLILYGIIYAITKSKNISLITFIGVASFIQIFIILDGLIFNLYRFHVNGFVLQLIIGAGNDIFIFDFAVVLKFLFLCLAVVVIPFLIGRYCILKFYSKLSRRFILTTCILLCSCIVFSHITHAAAAGLRQTSIQKSATILPYFFPLTMNSLLLKLGVTNKDDIKRMKEITASDINYPKNIIVSTDSIPEYNILYILIDSWNPTTFSDTITPNIYKLAQQSDNFKNHFSSSSGTRGSIFGLFFGAPLAYRKDLILTQQSPVFINQLIDKGYDIQTFPSANFTAPPFHEDIFRRVPTINTQVFGNTPFERDSTITSMTIEYLKDQPKHSPFFAFTFYDTAHAISLPSRYNKHFTPAWDSADYMALDNNIDREPFFNLYKNCIFYVDSLIGKILNEVDTLGLLKNTVIVITGDHGQEFNENHKNYWGHGSNYSKWQTKVPFFIHMPGQKEVRYFDHMTTHFDVSATILNQFLGVKNPYSDYTVGTSLYDTISRYPHIVGSDVNYGFLFENKIVQTNHLGTLEVYDTDMNELPENSISAKEASSAIKRKNHFYK